MAEYNRMKLAVLQRYRPAYEQGVREGQSQRAYNTLRREGESQEMAEAVRDMILEGKDKDLTREQEKPRAADPWEMPKPGYAKDRSVKDSWPVG